MSTHSTVVAERVPPRQIWLLHVQFALVVLGLLLGRTVRDALYLSRAGVDRLPLLYAAVGVIVAGAALVWGRLQRGSSMRTAAIRLHVLFAASFVLFGWLGPRLGNPAWGALYLWVEILAALSVAAFWNVVNERFEPGEARRAYGRIAAGQAVGNVACGVVSHLVAGGGPVLMLGAAAAVSGASALLYLAIPPVQTVSGAKGKGQGRLRARQRQLEAGRMRAYAWTLLALVAVTYLVTSWVDFQFKVIARRSLDERGLTVFFGTFYAVVGVVAFVVQLFIFPRLSRWLGSFRALALMPAAFLVSGLLLPWAVAVTRVVSIGAKFAESALRYAVYDPLLQVFWLPLSPEGRARFQSLASGVVKPLAIAAGGLLLWPLRPDAEGGVDAALLGWPIAAGSAAILALLWLLRRRYVALLAEQTREVELTGRAVSLEGVDIDRLSDLVRTSPPGAAAWIARRLAAQPERQAGPAAVAVLARSDLPEALRIQLAWECRESLTGYSDEVSRALVERTRDLERAASAGRMPAEVEPDSWLMVARLAALAQRTPVDDPELLPDPTQVHPASLTGFWPVAGPEVRTTWIARLVDAAAWRHLRQLVLYDPSVLEALATLRLLRNVRGRLAVAEAIAEASDDVWEALKRGAPGPYWRWLGPLWWRVVRRLPEPRVAGLAAELVDEEDPWYLAPLALTDVRSLEPGQADPERWLTAAERFAAAAAATSPVDARGRLWRSGMLRRCECAVQLVVRLWERTPDTPLVGMARSGLLTDAARRSAFVEALDSDWSGPGSVRSRLLALLDFSTTPAQLPSELAVALDPRMSILFPEKESAMTTAVSEAALDAEELLQRILALADVPLFANLEGEELALIAEAVEPLTLDPGTRIIRQGDDGDSLYVIVAGSVGVYVGDRRVAELGAGAVVGEMAVIDRQPRSADVVAEGDEPVRVLRLWKEDFDLLLEAWPQIGRGVMQVLTQRLREATQTAS